MSEAMLLEIVAAASVDAGRTLRVLERRTQSQDHPILLTVPETHYLKCLIPQGANERRGRRFRQPLLYSSRKTRIGSRRAARIAGTSEAIMVTAVTRR